MQVTVTTLMGDVFSLEVPEDLELENFKAFCEAESGVPAKEMVIMFNGTVLKDDKKPLKEHGVKVGFEFYDYQFNTLDIVGYVI